VVLSEQHEVIMKAAKERQVTEKVEKKKENRQKAQEGEVNFELFELLRRLRLEIAKEEHMPPYIIFSDKTLRHMSMKEPVSEEEFLMISGVGETKCKKYGQRFIDVVVQYKQS
jgi:ATP-dependent DNA helicase RecQ